MGMLDVRQRSTAVRLLKGILLLRSGPATPHEPGSHAGLSISVRRWLLVLVACGVAGIIILALYGKWQVGRIYDSASYANVKTIPRVVALEEARAHFTRWRMALYRHVVDETLQQQSALDDIIAQERAAMRTAMDRYDAMSVGEDRQQLDIARGLMAEYERDALAADEHMHDGQSAMALRLLSTNADVADRVVGLLDSQIADNVTQGRNEDAHALTAFIEASWTTLVFVLMVVSALLAVGYLVGRRITEQVERIRLLAQDNEMFRLMLEGSSNQSVMLHDGAGGRVIYANAAACRHFGVDKETLLSWYPADFDQRVDEALSNNIETALAQDGIFTFETEHRVASGELVPVEVTINHFEHGGRRLGMTFFRDLRPQREAEERRSRMQRLEAEHENARQLTRFARSAPGFMYTLQRSADGKLAMTYASPAVEDILGLGVEDVLADISNFHALIFPEDLEKVQRPKDDSRRLNSPFHAQYRIHHPARGVRWMEAHSMPDAMEDGSVQWHGFITDITERKALEDALAAREREFRTLIESAPDNIIRYDLDLRITYMNQVLEKTLGKRLEEVLGYRNDEVFPHMPVMLEYQQVLKQVIDTGRPAEYLMVAGKDGLGRPLYDNIRIAPELSPEGEVMGAIAVGRDLTRQKELEMEVSRREQEFRALSENSPDMIIRYDLDCRRIYVNQAFIDASGMRAEDVLHKPLTQGGWWALNCSAEDFERHLRYVIRTGEPASVQLFGCMPITGQPRHSMARIAPEFDQEGRVCSLIAVVRDVTDLVQLQMEIAGREREVRSLVENTPDVIIRYDRTCRRIYISSNYEQVYGTPVALALGKKPTEVWGHPRMNPAEYEARIFQAMVSGIATDIELDWYTDSGEYMCQSMRVVPELSVTGEVDSILTLSRDVSESKRAALQLLAREREFRTLVEHSPDTICRYDLDARRIYANPKFVEEFGVTVEQFMGKTPSEFPGGESAQAYEKQIRQTIASGQASDFELHWLSKDQHHFCSHVRLTPEFGQEGGRVTGVLAVGRDITEIDEYRKRVHRMAFYDALTDLPNRSLLNDRIGHTIADASYHGHRFGLMMLDLDGFKEVNDTLGHGVGDELLRQVGDRLLGCVRTYDTVARLGGDEFAVLLPEVREDANAGTVARKILDALADPFNISGKEMFVSASIGIALYPSDSADIEGLFRYADSAMYHAKKQGRNNFQFYSTELTARSGERMALESALRHARKRKELLLHYQPQVDIVSGRLIGAEALLRWNRGSQGMIPPDRFIPIAEETGLIVGIGEWVLENACETAVAWNTGRKSPLKIAVNLSTRQFVRNDLAKSVRAILDSTGCKPEWLSLEITESLLLEDVETIRHTLAELSGMGISIAIDDFGIGYSALAYLNRFPVRILKIDRSFVRDITTDRDRAELVKAIISMARSLRLGLVAEGVETDAEVAYLSNLGCHVVQGYLFGKPMPRTAFEALLTKSDWGPENNDEPAAAAAVKASV